MRAGTESALARVVNVFGPARPHHAYLFANRRANQTTFSIPIFVCGDRVPVAPAARQEGSAVPARGQEGPASRPCLASQVFERLREDILEGQLGPGEKLRMEALQARYHVGASPIREALNRLTSVRLVEQVERRGFRVATLSNDDLLELILARRLLNEVVVRESLVHGDEAWEQELVVSYHRMWRCPMTMPSGHTNREWELLHRKFHAAVIAACPSRWLLDFHELLFDSADRHRRLNVRRLDAEFTRIEHRQIMEAAVSRDAQLTVRLLNESMDTLVAPNSASVSTDAPGHLRVEQRLSSADAPVPRPIRDAQAARSRACEWLQFPRSLGAEKAL